VRIFAADPGGVTGWSLFKATQREWSKVGADVPLLYRIDYGTCGPHQHHAELEDQLTALLPLDLIICERFESRNNDFALLISLEYIGVVKAFAQRHKIKIVLQGSSEAKRFTTNIKLRRLGWLLSPQKEMKDVNDSERHVVFWVCNSIDAPRALQLSVIRMVSRPSQ
jgi:hypothetical protein